MSEEQLVELSLEQVADYEFRIRFDGSALADLITDESPPLGSNAGPDPARLLLAAVANCLAASLTFALRKFGNASNALQVKAHAKMTRNESRRWRISGIEVDLRLADAVHDLHKVERALAQFEDFCVVTESVRGGIPSPCASATARGTWSTRRHPIGVDGSRREPAVARPWC